MESSINTENSIPCVPILLSPCSHITQVGVSFCANPKFHPIGMGWNLIFTQKIPTPAQAIGIVRGNPRFYTISIVSNLELRQGIPCKETRW